MRPRAHQARSLIRERRQLDLQAALMGARPRAKDFENEACPVDDFRLPVPLEIALLHRAQGGIDNDNPDLVFFDQLAESVKGSRAEQAARPRAGDAGYLRPDD